MRITTWRLIFPVLIVLLASTGFANVGKVIIAKGETYAIDMNDNYRALNRRSDIQEGDTIVTGKDSELHIRFKDNAMLALRADTQLMINDYRGGSTEQDKVFMELLSGGFRTITGSFGKSNKDAYEIKTPNASIGIRGTNYEALLTDNSLLIGVYDGGIWVLNNTGDLFLGNDVSFSFAQVSGMDDIAEGLLEAPEELSQPLTTSFLSSGETNEESESEASAELSEEDDALLVENLFEETPAVESVDTETTTETITSLNVSTSVTEVENTIEVLAESADVRLTAAQVATLTAGTDVGFVVVNQNRTGYRIANYQLSAFAGYTGVDTTNTVSFDITMDDQTYSITLQTNYTSASELADEMNSQIKTQQGTIDTTQIAPIIYAESTNDGNSDYLVLKGFIDDSGQSIIIDNFSGTSAVDVAIGIGLCDGSTIICSGSYDSGELSSGDYSTAIHFGYVLDKASSPVFVNYESERLSVLDSAYVVPDNVFKGNEDASLTYFDSVNTEVTDENLVEWGYWASSSANPATLYKDPQDLSNSEDISTPFFFVTAPPIDETELVGELTLSTVVDWHATSSNTSGTLNSADGTAFLNATLAVSFDNAKATGTLNLADESSTWNWDMQYFGKIEDVQFFSDYGWGTFQDGTDTLDAVGDVNGLFTPAEDASGVDSIGFVGGFGLQTTDDSQWSQGVFILK